MSPEQRPQPRPILAYRPPREAPRNVSVTIGDKVIYTGPAPDPGTTMIIEPKPPPAWYELIMEDD